MVDVGRASPRQLDSWNSLTSVVMLGRLCSTQGDLPDSPTCCLPCPDTYWTYPESFSTYNTVAAWLNVVGFILLVFLLTSFFLLPVQTTRRHYLSICLVIAVIFLNLGFIIPLGAKPDQCYNEITPNDMYSSMTCAWSGAFIIAGSISGAMWIFIRALSMHIQICWDIIPGQKFFYTSQVVGWGIPAALFAVTISVTGVSFRFGSACHVNHRESMQTFWGWLLGMSASATLLQLATFVYCAHVFISNLWSAGPERTQVSVGSLPTYTSSIRAQTAKAIWRRLKSVLFLQWRGILVVTITLVDVIFFAVVFVYLDNLENSLSTSFEQGRPWLLCLVMTGGDKDHCMPLSQKWLVRESVVGAVLIMLSLIGLEVFCLLFRWSLLSGWRDYIVKKLSRKQEFVSWNALQITQPRPAMAIAADKFGPTGIAFEMQKPKQFVYDIDAKTVRPVVNTMPSPEMLSIHARGHHISEPDDHFDKAPQAPFFPTKPVALSTRSLSVSSTSDTRPSFSSSRVISDGLEQSMGWDPTSTFASSSTPTISSASARGFEDRGFVPGQAL
ncbi:hypothetical protein BDV97DRAFT_368817 [Delphinella strobiligena]|nr:hypothetical protein BDV97DRAFT_368817 [Delphinella strobiligena]